MSDRYPSPPDDTDDSRPPRPVGHTVAVLVAALAVVAVVVVLALRSAGVFGTTDPAPGSTATAGSPTEPGSPVAASGSASPGVSASPGTTPSAGATGRSSASKAPSGKAGQGKPQPTRSPVPLKTPAEIQSGLTASISDMRAVEGEAQGPGEIAGPAVRFTLHMRNDSDRELPLTTTVVNVYYGKDERPASPLESQSTPLPAAVGPGSEVTATYVYVIPEKSRDDVLITVDYSVDVSLVAFRGKAPR